MAWILRQYGLLILLIHPVFENLILPSLDPQRLNFLEALEVAFTIGHDPGGVLHLHRDFNESV